MIDAHFHVFTGHKAELRRLVESSVYRNKYLAYDSIDLDSCEYKDHCLRFENVFCIPFFLREYSLRKANEALKQVIPSILNGLAVPLIDDNDPYMELFESMRIIGGKEHFLLHNAFSAYKRKKCYDFLQQEDKFLLIHCKDSIRFEYLKYLRNEYPKLRIVIAHLGRVRGNDDDTKKIVDFFARDDYVYFELSTIFDKNILLMFIEKLRGERIIFGTDKPFVKNSLDEIVTAVVDITEPLGLSNKIMCTNARQLINLS